MFDVGAAVLLNLVTAQNTARSAVFVALGHVNAADVVPACITICPIYLGPLAYISFDSDIDNAAPSVTLITLVTELESAIARPLPSDTVDDRLLIDASPIEIAPPSDIDVEISIATDSAIDNELDSDTETEFEPVSTDALSAITREFDSVTEIILVISTVSDIDIAVVSVLVEDIATVLVSAIANELDSVGEADT